MQRLAVATQIIGMLFFLSAEAQEAIHHEVVVNSGPTLNVVTKKINTKSPTQKRSRECVRRVDVAFKRVLKIDWRPISVFPNEAKRF